MRRAKRDKEERAYKSGYKAGWKGHSYEDCQFNEATNNHAVWLVGWRLGRTDHQQGYAPETYLS